ncbi:MAG: hypothetical protein IJV06_06430 [Bacteroidaceae bacterium]|nr:hypothetical protein [Bacteroidaceae bacterium]
MTCHPENREPSSMASEPIAAYSTNSHRSRGNTQNIQLDEEELSQLRSILAKSEADFAAGRVYSHQEVKEMLNHYQYGNSLV